MYIYIADVRKLSRKEIGEHLLALAPGESFILGNNNERIIASSLLSSWNMLVGKKREPPVVRTFENSDGTFTARRELDTYRSAIKSRSEIKESLLKLAPGKSFTVGTYKERLIANSLIPSLGKSKVVRTWANGDGTFTVACLR